MSARTVGAVPPAAADTGTAEVEAARATTKLLLAGANGKLAYKRHHSCHSVSSDNAQRRKGRGTGHGEGRGPEGVLREASQSAVIRRASRNTRITWVGLGCDCDHGGVCCDLVDWT